MLTMEAASLRFNCGNAARTHKNALRGWVSWDDSAGSLAYLLAGPEGWFYQEQVVLQRLYERRVMALLDGQSGRLHPHEVEDSRKALERDLAGSAIWRHNAMSRLLLNKLLDLFEKVALAQTRAELAATACALERFRLTRGNFPETLGTLVPQFADTVPLDICDSRPLKYRQTTSDTCAIPTVYGVDLHPTILLSLVVFVVERCERRFVFSAH